MREAKLRLNDNAQSLRLDKWLWQARFFKSRTQASRLCSEGRIRVNGKIISKANYQVRPGEVVTFPQGRGIRAVRVLALGTRRGPAAEAAALYDDLLSSAAGMAPAPA